MPDLTDTQTAEQTPPLPAPGEPHAYIAVRRTHSPHADRPEWFHRAQVVPAWDEAAIAYALKCGETLLPIGPSGDTGTRWVPEQTDTQTTERDQLAALLRDHGAPIPDEGYPADEYDCCAQALLEAGVRLPARVIESAEELDTLPVGAVVRYGNWIEQQRGPGEWEAPGIEGFSSTATVFADAAAESAEITVLHIPTQEGQADA